MSLSAALAYLDAHLNREATAGRIDGLSLEPIRALLRALGDPHTAYPAIHITGTNGKGSVAAMTSALLEALGLTVGMYTSPHVERLNERLARNREPIDDESLAEAILGVAAVEDLAGVQPSYFEILTAAAFSWFAEVAIDVAVVEVGLLGRWDATNVIDGSVAVITQIGRDHTDGAGDWRRAVAGEKAGIIKPGSMVVVGEPAPDVRDLFTEPASEGVLVLGEDFGVEVDREAVGGRLIDLRTPYGAVEEVFLPLHGAHQARNAALAVAAVEAFFQRPLEGEVVGEAFADLALPGRFEIVGRAPLVVLDGAHNPEGAAALAATLGELSSIRERAFVIGFLEGRDADLMLEQFGVRAGDTVLACAPPSPRAMDVAVVAGAARARGADIEVAADVADAVDRARNIVGEEGAVIITGSLYVVGPARTHLLAER